MNGGRKPKFGGIVKKNICLPEDLVLKWELLLADPLRGKSRYGSWSMLIERLLREELGRMASTPPPPNP